MTKSSTRGGGQRRTDHRAWQKFAIAIAEEIGIVLDIGDQLHAAKFDSPPGDALTRRDREPDDAAGLPTGGRTTDTRPTRILDQEVRACFRLNMGRRLQCQWH